MATQKALFTNKNDFTTPGIAPFSVDPYIYYNGVDLPNETPTMPNNGANPQVIKWAGTGTVAKEDSPMGQANVLNGRSVKLQNWGVPKNNKHTYSVWVKPTMKDVEDYKATQGSGNNFRIIATQRGDAWPNRGLHLALDNGRVAVRTYDSGGAYTELITDGSDATYQPLLRLEANTWHHITVVYDLTNISQKLAIYVDKVKVAFTNTKYKDISTVDTYNSFTIGDMLGGYGDSQGYNFNGAIDEFMYILGDAWTPATITEYYDYIYNADFWAVDIGGDGMDATLRLAKSFFTQEYTQTIQSWTSPSIDLGPSGYGDFARVQLNYDAPAGTTVKMYTRSSSDGVNWGPNTETSPDGTINSENKQYLQIFVQFWTVVGTATPLIQEIQVLDYPAKKRLQLTTEPLIIFKDLDTGLERVGELARAYDVYITEEINGEETIEFKVATNDPVRKRLGSEPVEMIARIGDKQFHLKSVLDQRTDAGKKYTQFEGEALWYELRGDKIPTFEQVEQKAETIMQAILDQAIVPTGWTIYKVQSDGRKRTIRGDWKSIIELFQMVVDQFGGELQFDTIERTVSLVTKNGQDNGVRFYYNKNLKTIKRTIETYDMVTRLYVYGKEDMTVKAVHPDGLEYLEDLTWVNALNLRKKIRIDKWSDERYTIPQNLYDDGMKLLTESAKPLISYEMSVQDLSMLSGHEHESIGLGDSVYIVDTELLNMTVNARIVKRKYDVREPWKTEIELDYPKKELADANQRAIDDQLEQLTESSPVDTSDVQQMTVFNHLLNSRAEDGITYWEQSGTGITPVIGGFSGDASWQIDSGFEETNILKQSVFGVSHRSAYTVSAYVASQGDIYRGSSQDAFVGILVRIHYTEPDAKGNTFEEHLLAIPDITQQGGS